MQKTPEHINNFIINQDIDATQKIIQNLAIGNYEGVILDIQNSNFVVSDLPLVVELFAQKQFVIIGIRSTSIEVIEFAKFSNIAIFNTTATIARTNVPKYTTQNITHKPTIVRGNIDKHQQVFAKNCDLVVTGNVLDSAEAISDESVMIYGGGYGKVFAGIKNKNASIFVNYFQLKLVCIDGMYKKFDTIPKEYFNKSIIITLIDEKLNFKIL